MPPSTTARQDDNSVSAAAVTVAATTKNPWVIVGALGVITIDMMLNHRGNAPIVYPTLFARDNTAIPGPTVIGPPVSVPAPAPSTITLYRGVHAGHPGYANALLGMATPVGGIATPVGGIATPEQHSGGNYNSNYTSWSMFRTVADYHANKNGPGGIVLKKVFVVGQYLPNLNYFSGEGEFLVPGAVIGATPIQPLGPGNPTGY